MKIQYWCKDGNNTQKIVEDSTFTHRDAYELGAKLIAMGNAEETIALIKPVLIFKES
ncbi:hypothetical protein [Methanobrevibacter sp.]|uniref:hypothetical protein n=1 Tax=Methanobrevibacter sp. TaxID=66852 RepID=UPI0025E9D691|nr:hypothetical protein [Methanobrevibacter sp.]MEE0024032.1 hypothetical protein [Methanobrevibacter sp.]